MAYQQRRRVPLNAFRVGVYAGAAVAALLLVVALRDELGYGFAWVLIGCFSAAGGGLGGGVVLAAQHLRQSLQVLLKALLFVGVLSAFALLPHAVDALRARNFLAQADSTPGVVSRMYARQGKHLWVTPLSAGGGSVVKDRVRYSTSHLKVGDTVWVYFDPTDPARPTIGRPGPDWAGGFRSLIPVWAFGGVLFLGYGVHAAPAGVPTSWRTPVRMLRAYVGSAAMADVGFALAAILVWTAYDPRDEVVSRFWDTVFIGALFSLICTAVLGGIGLGVLLERRSTSAFAFGLCGLVLGGVGVLLITGPAGPAGLLAGGIPGLLAGFTFRWLAYWGGDPFAKPVVAVQPAPATGPAGT